MEEDKAAQEEKSVRELMSELAADNRSLEWVSGYDIMQQTISWVNELKAGKIADFESSAADFLEKVKAGSQADILYNIACAYAVMSFQVPEKKEEYGAKAVSLLNRLAATDYFKSKPRLDNLMGDTDLDTIRNRQDFASFLERIKP